MVGLVNWLQHLEGLNFSILYGQAIEILEVTTTVSLWGNPIFLYFGKTLQKMPFPVPRDFLPPAIKK